LSERSERRHIPVEELALLTEPGEGVTDDETISHLSACARCLAVYSEFVQARAGYLRESHADMPPVDLVERVLNLTSPAATAARAATPTANVARGRRKFWIPTAAAAALTAMALVGLLTMRPSRPAVPDDLRVRLCDRMRTNAPGGVLLFADSLLPRSSGTRGSEAAAPDLDLAPLVAAYRDRPRDPEIAYWLVAGLLAIEDQRNAEACSRQALARFPDDARFHNLAALGAYKASDLVTAEKELQTALRLERSPEVLVNMAQVLCETGRSEQAVAFLAEVVEHHASSPVAPLAAKRAGAVLRGLQRAGE